MCVLSYVASKTFENVTDMARNTCEKAYKFKTHIYIRNKCFMFSHFFLTTPRIYDENTISHQKKDHF